MDDQKLIEHDQPVMDIDNTINGKEPDCSSAPSSTSTLPLSEPESTSQDLSSSDTDTTNVGRNTPDTEFSCSCTTSPLSSPATLPHRKAAAISADVSSGRKAPQRVDSGISLTESIEIPESLTHDDASAASYILYNGAKTLHRRRSGIRLFRRPESPPDDACGSTPWDFDLARTPIMLRTHLPSPIPSYPDSQELLDILYDRSLVGIHENERIKPWYYDARAEPGFDAFCWSLYLLTACALTVVAKQPVQIQESVLAGGSVMVAAGAAVYGLGRLAFLKFMEWVGSVFMVTVFGKAIQEELDGMRRWRGVWKGAGKALAVGYACYFFYRASTAGYEGERVCLVRDFA